MEQKLNTYQQLLHKWQKRINLVSNSTISESWERHFQDSLQLIDLIHKEAKTVLDLGSGAGFPGLVIAISRPDLNVYLVEADQKKCSFLKTVSRETKTAVHIINDRIENSDIENPPDIISARALASLDQLFNYCTRWINQNPNLQFIFPKGQNFQSELDEASKNWQYEHQIIPSKTNENSVIILFKNVKKQ